MDMDKRWGEVSFWMGGEERIVGIHIRARISEERGGSRFRSASRYSISGFKQVRGVYSIIGMGDPKKNSVRSSEVDDETNLVQ